MTDEDLGVALTICRGARLAGSWRAEGWRGCGRVRVDGATLRFANRGKGRQNRLANH
jgi:hypothetical protein